jgi:ADP-ribosyl-[dinitrogen reductase] hydrolase
VSTQPTEITQLDRAQGCLLGQLAGDALGSLVEFQSAEQIRQAYPDGVRELADGGTFNTIAGQPTDDSEMALALARTIVGHGTYNAQAALDAYLAWLNSAPFDCGNTIRRGLLGHPDHESQANGALMRISPLGIFGANHDLKQVARWAVEDALLTHPHPVCQQANALYTMAISQAIQTGSGPETIYRSILGWAEDMAVEPALLHVLKTSQDTPPKDYLRLQGWVLIALGNALWQMLHASDVEAAIVDTVMRGGDTDTNGAICGALLGAVHGLQAIPAQWQNAVLNCRPKAGQPGVYQPRPETYWPVDALELVGRITYGSVLR